MVTGVALLIGAGMALSPAVSSASATRSVFPRYQHIVEIVMENTGYHEVIGNSLAPQINALAKKYGQAVNFFGVTHPSEPNYLAGIAGSYFGIQDDNPFYCTASMSSSNALCNGTTVDHTVSAPNLAQQLTAAGKSWRGYFQSLPPTPSTGGLITSGPNANGPYTYMYPSTDNGLYASKHNPFLNFTSTQGALTNMVPDTRLASDLASSRLATFSMIVPDQCHDMHGTGSCTDSNSLISTSDQYVGATVKRIMASRTWRQGYDAIVITWDENETAGSGQLGTGCCGANPGGGHVVTIVITNHGKLHLTDRTPYNHYSLLRSLEFAFGLPRLAHAADRSVPAMTKLFSVNVK